MSSKKSQPAAALSTEIVTADGEVLRKFNNLLMNQAGEELPSNQSLTTTIRLPSLGERVQRYMRTPQLQQDFYNDPDLWDDDEIDEFFDYADDGSLKPVSPHSDSYQAALDHRKKRLDDEAATAKKLAQEEDAQRKADFRKRVREARDDIEIDQEVKSKPPAQAPDKSSKDV